ncbi:hypothetical protein C2G38_2161948 [Gigaspora rosea]|uniref:Uncharacterized protein n=1 Tax=Gigaspora rosea TaxID=44941 RepID=A0A397VYE9_9GLOM|nr:hypothetical protein C2G38_2161948 [Gigaspora rosea]
MKVLIHKAHEFKSNDKTIIKALSLLRVIRHEILIMYNVSISDWMTAIIPPLFMAIAFGTWISLVSCYYIIIGTNLRIFELLNSELNIFKLGICFFVMTTTQVQDLRDQKGDKFVGRKTLPLLIGDNICYS